MHLDRDAAAVVLDRDRAVVVDRHGDLRGVAGHGLVDRVVDHFVDQVVQPAERGVGDVHAGPLADVLQVAEVLQVLGGVVVLAAAGQERIAAHVDPVAAGGGAGQRRLRGLAARGGLSDRSVLDRWTWRTLVIRIAPKRKRRSLIP